MLWFDFSEIGLNSPFSDISQLVISDIHRKFWTEDPALVEKFAGFYHENLVKTWAKLGISPKIDRDACFSRVKRDGIEKWAWFLVILANFGLDNVAMEHFFAQFGAFVEVFGDFNENYRIRGVPPVIL
jgi:hypothetical protein